MSPCICSMARQPCANKRCLSSEIISSAYAR
jgi:hypothetical protein